MSDFYSINENSEERVLLNAIRQSLINMTVVATPSSVIASSFVSVISSTTGTIPANALSWSVVNYGVAAGTFNGVNIPQGMTLSSNYPLIIASSIAFNATGTTFRIDYYL